MIDLMLPKPNLDMVIVSGVPDWRIMPRWKPLTESQQRLQEKDLQGQKLQKIFRGNAANAF